MIKVSSKQKPYKMWQAGISLAALPLTNSLAGFAWKGIWRLCRSPAHESSQLRRLNRREDHECDANTEDGIGPPVCIHTLFERLRRSSQG